MLWTNVYSPQIEKAWITDRGANEFIGIFSRSMDEEGTSTLLSLLPDCGHRVTSDITLPPYLPIEGIDYILLSCIPKQTPPSINCYFGLINKKSYWWFEWEMSPVGTCN